jgi:quercetin dioxygenase-like cupin family protein
MFVTVPDADETHFHEWHAAPDPRLVVCLGGESIQQTTNGEERRFHAGDVFLTVDVTGRGHRSANKGTTSYLIVRLSDTPTA